MTSLVEIPNGRLPDIAAVTDPSAPAVAQSPDDVAETLRCAIDLALQEGLSPDAIAKMVAERTYQLDLDGVARLCNEYGEPQRPPVYAELPPGMIDVPTAVRKHGINRKTLHWWIDEGKVRVVGRLKGAAPGRGYLLVMENELVAYKNAPRRKAGRKKKLK